MGLRRLVGAIPHLFEHGVGDARFALGRFVVVGQHLDEHGDVGAVGFEMAEAEIVHDRAGPSDRLASRVEMPGETLETADPDQAVRVDAPVRRLVQDRPAAGERRVDVLRPPESPGEDVSDDVRLAPLVPGPARVRNGALLEVGCRLPVASPPREPSEESKRVRCAAVISASSNTATRGSTSRRMCACACAPWVCLRTHASPTWALA